MPLIANAIFNLFHVQFLRVMCGGRDGSWFVRNCEVYKSEDVVSDMLNDRFVKHLLLLGRLINILLKLVQN